MNEHNYEEYLIDYLHGELKGDSLNEMENFLQKNPNVFEEYQLLQQTLFKCDDTIVYENKNELLRSTNTKVVIFYPLKKMFAIAAILIGLIACSYFLFITNSHSSNNIESVVKDTSVIPTNSNPKNVISNITSSKSTKNSLKPSGPAKIFSLPNQGQVVFKNVIKSNVLPSTNFKQRYINTIVPEHNSLVQQKDSILKEAVNEHIDDKLNEVLVQQIALPRVEMEDSIPTIQKNVINDGEPIVSSRPVTHRGSLELNDQKQAKLFKAISSIIRFTQKIKHARESVFNKDLVVTIGNKKIINLN
jgi:hypothetical protein